MTGTDCDEESADDEARSPIESLLISGLDDWFMFGEVLDEARRDVGPRDMKARAVEMVGELLSADLVEVGDVGDRGFVPWGLSESETLLRISVKLDEVSDLDSVFVGPCWLSNTEKGDLEAKRILGLADA